MEVEEVSLVAVADSLDEEGETMLDGKPPVVPGVLLETVSVFDVVLLVVGTGSLVDGALPVPVDEVLV